MVVTYSAGPPIPVTVILAEAKMNFINDTPDSRQAFHVRLGWLSGNFREPDLKTAG
jgi:hypothetical protein